MCVCVLQAMCEAKPEEGRVDNLLFPKISTGSGCLCLWVPRGHGESDGSTPDHTHPPSVAAGSSGLFENIIKGLTHQTMEPGKRTPHTQTPPRSTMGQVPAFHLAAPPRVLRWSRWSCLYGIWVLGSCPAVSLAPVDHLTRLCYSVCPASSQVQGHPPHSSDGS